MPPLPSPASLRAALPLPDAAAALVRRSRRAVIDALAGTDPRLLVVIGPCSVHDVDGAREYARAMKGLADETADSLLVVLRCYVEKSRTGNGWRGIARDPLPARGEGTASGLRSARAAVLAMLGEGVPVGAELVSPFLWPYWADGLSWASVGARGVESQALRECAQALPCACGFKNGRDGRLDAALNAAQAAAASGSALVTGDTGAVEEIAASGNPLPHVILRGGESSPNWRLAPRAAAALKALGLAQAIVVDASHGNSRRDPERQLGVALAALAMRARGTPVRGVMVESYLEGGRQELAAGRLPSARLSVTDPCLGLEASAELLRALARRIRKGRP